MTDKLLCNWCISDKSKCDNCFRGSSFEKKRTNEDWIKSMPAEELAGWLATNDTCPYTKRERDCNNRCGECWLGWLKEEATS